MDNDQKEEYNILKTREELTDDEEDGAEICQTTSETKTSEQHVTVRFENMLIDSVNSTTLHLDWCPATVSDQLHGYKIRYSMKESDSHNEIFVTPGITNYTISGLKPGTEYLICVHAVNDNEDIIQNCGTAVQKTESFDSSKPGSTPYVTAIAAAVLLTVAIVVPLTILIIAYNRRYKVPYITAVVGIILLLVAAIVPITFLLARKCSICSFLPDKQQTDIAQSEVIGAFFPNSESNNSSEIYLSTFHDNDKLDFKGTHHRTVR